MSSVLNVIVCVLVLHLSQFLHLFFTAVFLMMCCGDVWLYMVYNFHTVSLPRTSLRYVYMALCSLEFCHFSSSSMPLFLLAFLPYMPDWTTDSYFAFYFFTFFAWINLSAASWHLLVMQYILFCTGWVLFLMVFQLWIFSSHHSFPSEMPAEIFCDFLCVVA